MAPLRITYPTAIVLLALSRGLRYGFEIMDATGLASGTVYPILRRLESARLLTARWEPVRTAREDQRPPRRYYQITGAGREALRNAEARFPGVARTLAPDVTRSPA
jgi:DNA-binding PadR family transcriptional regulator